ncbi:MAG: type II toxin-antitoxin system prevent-host-death family antitoxin [Desulfobacteraceae bacterium]|nr:MAG: type II toxin-antitoxin system prevent-host-death family antitoxin [Desulfobacteraceae bacterium]
MSETRSIVLTRRGEPIAAIVSIEELKLLQELEDQTDIEDAWKDTVLNANPATSPVWLS